MAAKNSFSYSSPFPACSGQYEVGCIDLMQEPGLLVRLYYPTESGLSSQFPYAPWLSHSFYGETFSRLVVAREGDFLSSPIDTSYNPATNALYGAPLIKDAPLNGFPVIVFSHGLTACRLYYSALCSDMASNGYVVAVVEHKDESACASLKRVPDISVCQGDYKHYVDQWIEHYFVLDLNEGFHLRHKQVKQRCLEVSQSLDLLQLLNSGGTINNMLGESYDFSGFTGQLDTGKAAVMGHSFGGATTIMAIDQDDRFKCGVILDAWMFPIHNELYEQGLKKPVIFINSYIFSKWIDNLSGIQKLVKPPNKQGISESSVVTIRGTLHFNQCDIMFAVPTVSQKYQSRLDKYVAFQINSDISLSFLKRFLLKEPSYQGVVPNLDDGSNASEHIIFHKESLL